MTTLQESRFSYLTNPQRVKQTSDIINNADLDHKRINTNNFKTQTPRVYHKLPLFTSPVKNSHLYPMIKGNFEKPYTQPPVYSQLYKRIDNDIFEVNGKFIKRKDLKMPPLVFE